MSHHGSVHKCGDEHNHEENHLCRVVVREDWDRVKKIVRDATHYCKSCGRAANDACNLCRPAKI